MPQASRRPPKRCLRRYPTCCCGGSRNGDRGAGFRPFAPTGSRVPPGIGGDMRVRLPDRELFGRGEALDEHGRLAPAPCRRRLADDHGRRCLSGRGRAAGSPAGTGARQLMAGRELVFAPLGGIGEIGMNLSIYGVGDGAAAAMADRRLRRLLCRPRSTCPASI